VLRIATTIAADASISECLPLDALSPTARLPRSGPNNDVVPSLAPRDGGRMTTVADS
jgi:hypothetical protein